MSDTHDTGTAVAAELEKARVALAGGNDGKARVCARRAVGTALNHFYAVAGAAMRGTDAMSLLLRASDDGTLPDRARAAAFRLTTKISERNARPFSDDPVGDARIIVDAVLPETGRKGS